MAELTPPWPTGIDRTFKVTTPEGEREVDAYSPEGFRILGNLWTRSAWQNRLSYEPTWLGIPIIQLPEDMVMLQELVWKVRPDVIVESGIAHGGGLVFFASLLELLGRGRVIGVDVEIRKYNRLAIDSHPMSNRIKLIEGDSVADATLDAVRAEIQPAERVLVVLDSLHTRDHVSAELERYAPLVTPESYVVVFDGVMELLDDAPRGAPEWADDNPLSAVRDFLGSNDDFEVDPTYNRLLTTHSPNGFLRRHRDSQRPT
ncbi:MAG TPA: CmcI family methyltransferase [Thermoleophilaceae bacterium]|jgi:cephalosporin hydroxylase